MDNLHALPIGTVVEEYRIQAVIGEGGFGITYKAWDMTLEKHVAIKEYFPSGIAVRHNGDSVFAQSSSDRDDFAWGLDRFLDEARVLARFHHPHIIEVIRFFEANSTAYIVMEFADGETLSGLMAKQGHFDEENLRPILMPLLDGLEEIHAANILHRDIKPGNIIIRKDGSPVLIDFGAARSALADKSQAVTTIVTPGYAPIEQYSSRGKQGPWTDIYALAGVAYKCLTGHAPDSATDRVRNDPLIPISQAAQEKGSSGFLSAIDWALATFETDRPQSTEQWRDALDGLTSPSSLRHAQSSDEPQTIVLRNRTAPSSIGQRKGVWAAVIILLVVAASALFFVASERNAANQRVASDLAEWSRAQQENTIDSYEKYQRIMPDGAYQEQADEEIARLREQEILDAWEAAEAINTIDGYTDYLRQYPNSSYSTEAMAARDGLVAAEERTRETQRAEEERRIFITNIQEELLRLGYDIGRVDGAIGRSTVAAIRAFEDGVNVPITGEATTELLRLLQETDLRPGRSPGTVFKDCPICPSLVVIPAGAFMIGSPSDETSRDDDEGPQREITIEDDLAVALYEVTFEEWEVCVAEGGCPHEPDDENWGTETRPVINVSWNDAQSYVQWLSRKTDQTYRLLSESEWEYMARAGGDTTFSYGNDSSQLCSHGNIADQSAKTEFPRWRVSDCRDGFVYTAPVGNYRANAFGIYDVHGNIREWVQDCFRSGYSHIALNGKAYQYQDCERRVIRGGAWIDIPQHLRTANRNGDSPEKRDDLLGFRVTRTMN